MAINNEVRAVLYGGSAILDENGRVYVSAAESITGLASEIQRGLVFNPECDDDTAAKAMVEADITDCFDILEPNPGRRPVGTYYDLYANAIERMRPWAPQVLIVEADIRGMDAAARLGAQLFAVTNAGSLLEHAQSLGAVGFALPGEFDLVDRYISDHTRVGSLADPID